METQTIEELNKEYNKYAKSIVKLLDESLKQDEYFVFKKSKGGSYGIVLSREREEITRLNYKTKISKILDVLESEDKLPIEWVTVKKEIKK